MADLKLNYRVIPKTEVDVIMARYQDLFDLYQHGTPAEIHTVGLYQTQEAPPSHRIPREIMKRPAPKFRCGALAYLKRNCNKIRSTCLLSWI